MSFSALFSYVFDELKLLEYTGADNLECLYFALELIRSEESSEGIMSVQEDADYLKNLISDGDQERSLSFGKSAERVHIANLHKVKGLEANVVILADPLRSSKKPMQRTEYNDGSQLSLIFEVKVGKENEKYSVFSTKEYELQKEYEVSANTAEEKRLVYVAATRARAILIAADSRDETVL